MELIGLPNYKSMNFWCPDCGTKGNINVAEIPEHRREMHIDGTHLTEYMGDALDCTCDNCGCGFTITERDDSEDAP